MIGSFKGATSNSVVSSNYRVLLYPGSIDILSLPGSATSPLVTSTVVAGSGLYEYQWSITGSDISINNPDRDSTTFRASGAMQEYQEVATLTVTDKGNSDAKTSVNLNVNFFFDRIGL